MRGDLRIKSVVVFILSIIVNIHCAFSEIRREALYTGDRLEEQSLSNIVGGVSPGSVVIISEQHGNAVHHRHQLEFLQSLRRLQPQLKVSVAMEFFEYPDQYLVDKHLGGEISEEEFLNSIGWKQVVPQSSTREPINLSSGYRYDFYRPLVLHPLSVNGWTYAINAPRELTSIVGKRGMEGLSNEQRELLPPDFSLGGNSYFKRFKEVISGGHPIPEKKIKNYFAAQSIWDDTMAWQTLRILEADPQQVVVIIVGDFHNAYKDGLPARILARKPDQKLLSISQVDIEGAEESEIMEEMEPHPKWGIRADFIWTN